MPIIKFQWQLMITQLTQEQDWAGYRFTIRAMVARREFRFLFFRTYEWFWVFFSEEERPSFFSLFKAFPKTFNATGVLKQSFPIVEFTDREAFELIKKIKEDALHGTN